MPRRKHDPETLGSFIPPPTGVQHFVNEYGERWQFRFDPATGRGKLTGDELGDDEVLIVDGIVGGGLMLGADEHAWLDRCWHDATGEPLKSNSLAAAIQRAIASMAQDN